MTRKLDWAEFAFADFDTVDADSTIALLPVAAIEQHGPHLPVGTDMMIAQGMLDLLRTRCPEDLDLRILPLQAVGKSNEHLWARGTLTLSHQTALQVWTEIGLSVARAGVKKIAIVNSHGGNTALLSVLTRELRVQAGMLALTCGWGQTTPAGMYSDHELRFGIHGGDYETSLMRAFRPDLVDMSRARNFGSSAESTPLSPTGPAAYGWIASDLNPAGVVGDASIATAEKGVATAEHAVTETIALLQNLVAMPIPPHAAPTNS